MHDLFGKEAHLYARIVEMFSNTAHTFGFDEIKTPIVEETAVFDRTLGDESDVVQKQMYTFRDQNGLSLTLRPEATASVVRALIEHRLLAEQPELKVFYHGPMFRYERPQKGRQRQFYQFGLEYFGSNSLLSELLVVLIAHRAFAALGIQATLEINTLGDASERDAYLKALSAYLADHTEAACEDCKRRFTTNVLRVLDCKNEHCQRILDSAPTIESALRPETLERFNHLLGEISKCQIPYRWNRRLVRGFDYYTQTVFEFTSGSLGSQNAICAGGRYDGLVEQMGGTSTPAVGWALGVERLILLLDQAGATLNEHACPHILLAPIGDEAQKRAFDLLVSLTQNGIRCDMLLQDKRLKFHLKLADRLDCPYVLILGENELKANTIIIRNMKAETQTEIPLSTPDLVAAITRAASSSSQKTH